MSRNIDPEILEIVERVRRLEEMVDALQPAIDRLAEANRIRARLRATGVSRRFVEGGGLK